ncbi:hypothetical protein [Flavobacterium sp. NRK1]|uniref:hypothetical protein n=1 Tax=Flavobacterium sp. NRK1 TaxID=2954929 RepID=UPI0020922AA3|nr:hypothetical protein [Flavobacterium sp. NRK1]MCO6147184.1 hypothetical protein [Flavobacterium sp. NRK1]
MKNKFLLFGLCLSLMACSEESSAPVDNSPTENKVLMLKVDLLTSEFEGGKELTFDDASTFTIAAEYDAPGDFGGIKLKYEELNAPLFEGTVHWMGLGEISYPEINPAQSFNTIENAVSLPNESLLKIVEYLPFATPLDEWPYAPDYATLWHAVDNLEIVKEYRENNPNAKVNFFLYTPSVGVGNPAGWDWFIILKN